MRFLRRHWYDLGLIPAAVTIGVLVLRWGDMDVLQRLLLLNFVAIILHQYEEYGFPGGEPGIINIVVRPSEKPDRYPLNQNSAMLINVLATYGLYLVPVFFPRIIWLGLAPVLFGIFRASWGRNGGL